MTRRTFVLKEGRPELCGAAACLFSACCAWRLQEPVGVGFVLLFGGGTAWFYLKKIRPAGAVLVRRR